MQGIKQCFIVIIVFIVSIFYLSAHADVDMDKELIGLWKTYDLHHKARSIIQFYFINGEYQADIVQIISDPKDKIHCVNCKGHNQNKPLIGMTIIRGLKFKKNKWVEGEVVNTDSGNTYRCNITLKDQGETIDFHAYIGHTLIGRTVKWHRV